MLETLRGRLVLTHVLPLLLIIPLMGIALVYVTGARVLVPSILEDTSEQAALVAQLTMDNPGVWHDPAQAQALLARLDPGVTAHLMLLNAQGLLMASDDPADLARQGRPVDLPYLQTALAGQAVEKTQPAQLSDDVVTVLLPVRDQAGQVQGVVRLTHKLVGLAERFARLRYLIAAVLAASLLLGSAVGWVLGLNLARPLLQVTQAVSELPYAADPTGKVERSIDLLPEQGPTEVRILLHAVNTLVARLNAAEMHRREFLARLIHELGRPLGALHSAVDALQAGASDEVQLRDELLAGMSDELLHLNRLLDDLAGLRAQSAGRIELVRRPVDLGRWLPSLLATWREAAQAHELNWETHIYEGLPVLAIDPDRLAQAMGNLLSNAIRYTPPGGAVLVAAGCAPQALPSQPDGWGRHAGPRPAAWIEVRDTGPGIAAEEREQVFTPLYRGAARQGFPQGMGLGLAIARELVQAHGGQIEVAGEPGKGASFTIWLPVGVTAQPPVAAPQE